MKGRTMRLRTLLLVGIVALGFNVASASSQVGIGTCAYEITAPGRYVLTSDLICDGPGIIINASDVSLNMHGFTLTGPPGYGAFEDGIRVTAGHSRIRIANGTVSAFDDGIHLEPGATNVAITLMQLIGNDGEGLEALGDGHQDHYYAFNAASNNGGFGMNFDGDRFRLFRNVANNNGDDGFSQQSDNSLMLFNTANGNDGDGFDSRGTSNTYSSNAARDNDDSGFAISRDGNLLVGNRAIANDEFGISVFSRGNVITGNISQVNGDGATVDLADGNLPDACPNTWRFNIYRTDNDVANTCIR
jgi:hypothetical protein